jgi:oligoribonuclease (3'-5' exoribonuclease)
MFYSGSHTGEVRRNRAINWLFSANIDFSTIKDISLDSLWPKIQNNIDQGSNKYAHIYIADPIKIIGYFHKRRC